MKPLVPSDPNPFPEIHFGDVSARCCHCGAPVYVVPRSDAELFHVASAPPGDGTPVVLAICTGCRAEPMFTAAGELRPHLKAVLAIIGWERRSRRN